MTGCTKTFGKWRIVDSLGTVSYKVNGVLHREDGPAVVYASGAYKWYFNGVIHRDGGPARMDPDGTVTWVKYGLPHRGDGPAVILPSGRVYWVYQGKYLDFNDWCMVAGVSDHTRTMLLLEYNIGE